MSLFDHFKHKQGLSLEHLAGYKRLGEQVFEVETELTETTNAKARALLLAAKSLQVMGDALLRDVDSSDKHSLRVADVTQEQAESWYSHIPDLLVAVRKEAAFEGSSNYPLPFKFQSEHDMRDMHGTCPIEHLAGMRRASDEMENLVKDKMAYARTQGETYKDVILLFEEARTRRQSGDAIVGSIMNGQKLPSKSHEDAEMQYRMVLADYLLIAQALEYPTLTLMNNSTPSGTMHSMTMSTSQTHDIFRITSKVALNSIRHSPDEFEETKADLSELWMNHRVTETEQKYENTVSMLLSEGRINEDGYWYCCPFQSTYKVVDGPIHLIGHTIPTGHVFVWDYRGEGDAERFITAPSFRSASGRHHCSTDMDHGSDHHGSDHHGSGHHNMC